MSAGRGDVTHNTHRHLGAAVAERLANLQEVDPELHKLLSDYITSLRFQNARHRNQLRNLQNSLNPKEGSND